MSLRRHRHKKDTNFLGEGEDLNLTPMIDIVFLLLAFFMVTTDFTQEADLGVQLPSKASEPSDDLPEEHTIAILPSGEIKLNQAPMDHIESRGMPQLSRALKQLKISADSIGQKVTIIIEADSDSLHQRTVDVLNACSQAKIKYISFAD